MKSKEIVKPRYFKCSCGAVWRYPDWMQDHPSKDKEPRTCPQCEILKYKKKITA